MKKRTTFSWTESATTQYVCYVCSMYLLPSPALKLTHTHIVFVIRRSVQYHREKTPPTTHVPETPALKEAVETTDRQYYYFYVWMILRVWDLLLIPSTIIHGSIEEVAPHQFFHVHFLYIYILSGTPTITMTSSTHAHYFRIFPYMFYECTLWSV